MEQEEQLNPEEYIDEDSHYEEYRERAADQACTELEILLKTIIKRQGYYFQNKTKLMEHLKAHLDFNLNRGKQK